MRDEQYSRYVDYGMLDIQFSKSSRELLKNLTEYYDNECSKWFEDETFVEKRIPEFNFV